MRRPRRTTPLQTLALTAVTVALLTGCETGPAELSEQDQALIDAADVALVAGDDLTWDPETAEADAGTVSFAITCERSVNHNLVIDGEDVVECRPGETASGSTELDAGTYEFVCTVPGHEQRMRGELTVG